MDAPLQVDRLDVASLARGAVHRLEIALMEAADGSPIALPTLVARGAREGPVFGLTAAVHGNELNGIPVIHQLFAGLDVKNLRGTVVAVIVVNVPGYKAWRRTVDRTIDLNTVFPGRARGSFPEVYANRVIKRIASGFDRLCDLHTASFGRVNSFYVRADMDNPVTRRMAFLLRPQIVLHNPPSDRTLRGAVAKRGIPAVTLEIGDPQRFQPEMVRSALSGVRRLLAEAGMIARRKAPAFAPPVICDRSAWMYADRGGLLRVHPALGDSVSKGDKVATLYSLYGDELKRYAAPHDGVVIGKSANPAGPAGSRILHLGRRAPVERFSLRGVE